MKTILFVPHNHFDPTWRRCFDRPAEFAGLTVRSYADIEDLCISRWLQLAPQGYTFSEGQAAVLRKFLERHRDQEPLLRQYARDGRLDVMLAGEVIQDSNLPAAEGLVRNFLVAWPFYRDLVGQDHRGLRLGWVADAFGNSPNLPQVFRQLGAECVGFTTYRVCSGDLWTGIDGTSIFCYDWFPAVRTGAFEKHPPCGHCRGRGCQACGGTGLRVLGGFEEKTVRDAIEQAVARDGDWVVVWLTTEELLADPQIPAIIEQLNRQYAGRASIRFGNPSDIFRMHLPAMQATQQAQGNPPVEDLNPAMPGCYVSRIRCKQRTRAIAYKLIAAEAALANRAWQAGQPALPPEDLSEAWRLVVFNQFHDAITGTHIDSANAELMDMLDRAEAIADRHVPKVLRRKPRHRFVEVTEPSQARIGPFDIRFDRQGIVSILRDGQDVFGSLRCSSRAGRDFRIGELVLEPDFGDAWGRRLAPLGGEQGTISVIPLGNYHDRVEVAERALRWRGRYAGNDPMVRKLRWTVTVSLSDDGQRLDFVAEVDWDTRSRRLRVLVPVASQDDTATYEVPFGFIDRRFEPDRIDYSQWRANSMEWPALHWVRKKIDDRRGVALLNKGLPCNRWMPGRLDLSLLRSPEWTFCAVEPAHYEFWDTDGQRDAGRHRFEYSLWPYCDGLSETDLTRAGYGYNMAGLFDPKSAATAGCDGPARQREAGPCTDSGPIPLPFHVSGDVIVTAFKPAEDGSGWILRLQEAAGRGTTAAIDFPEPRRVTPADLLEQPRSGPVSTSRYEAPLHKHEILTLRIC